jgi:hypothetical protein
VDRTRPVLLVAMAVVLGATLLFGTLASTATASAAAGQAAQSAQASRAPQSRARITSLYDCIMLGRNLYVFYNSWNPYYAVLAAMRVGGCGDAAANYICYASRQWWGGAFRSLVWLVTWGHYTRC